MEKMNYKEHLNIYRNKKVFITGHTGFKGSWLTSILLELGAIIMGYSIDVGEDYNIFNLSNLKNKIIHKIGDIRDFELLNQCIQEFKPNFVFHLAAQALVKKSYLNPIETYSTNFMGSVNLLESVNKCDSINSLIFVTSDKCYENNEWVWGYRENDKIGGIDPYSSSKGAAEILFNSYNNSFYHLKTNFGAASVRAGNVIGGGDWSDNRIVPDCIKSIRHDKTIILRSPNSTRPWQHVLEPLSGYLLLGSKLFIEPKKYQGSWNFGPSSSNIKTVYDLADFLIKKLGKGNIKLENNNQFHEANLLQLNCDKANQLLKWKPMWDVESSFLETALWYKAYLNNEDVSLITNNQINKYFNF